MGQLVDVIRVPDVLAETRAFIELEAECTEVLSPGDADRLVRSPLMEYALALGGTPQLNQAQAKSPKRWLGAFPVGGNSNAVHRLAVIPIIIVIYRTQLWGIAGVAREILVIVPLVGSRIPVLARRRRSRDRVVLHHVV